MICRDTTRIDAGDNHTLGAGARNPGGWRKSETELAEIGAAVSFVRRRTRFFGVRHFAERQRQNLFRSVVQNRELHRRLWRQRSDFLGEIACILNRLAVNGR